MREGYSVHRGFTIVELAIVGALLLVLGALIFVLIRTAEQSARDVQRVSNIQQLRAGLERYFADHDRYPEAASAVALGVGSARCLDEDGFAEVCDNSGTTYLSPVPPDPGDGQYFYETPPGAGGYQLAFSLERGVANLASGPHLADPEGIR